MINLNSILATFPEWGAESAPTFTIWGRKAPPYIINDGFNGKIKEAYEKYENIIFSGFSTLNFVFSTMAGLALRENDIGYARFLSGKVQAVAHTLEMGKYNEYSPMLDIVCAGKDVEGTYKVVKHLLDNVGTMYDFRKSGLYKHMKFRDIDEAILDGVKEKLLEGFRNEEEFGYMAGYEPWEKLIFDR